MTRKILHISGCDKFIPPFVEFIKENFDFKQHEFLLTGGMSEESLIKAENVHLAKKTLIARLSHYFKVLIKMHQADKVILHGLFDIKLVFILFCTPWLLKKCYWVIWGGDLYVYQLGERNWKWKVREFFRRSVIKNMGNFITHTTGDFELAKKWYGASGKHHRCFSYISNMYHEVSFSKEASNTINILVGNSADPTNNHLEVFEMLETFKEQDIKIIVPLTYGDQVYAQEVINEGKKRFSDKFESINEHMSFDQYLRFLANIDIAIFNHKRQQAMGNIRTLLGMGKKVHMRNELTSTKSLIDDGIKVFSLDQINTVVFFPEADSNKMKMKDIYSKERLIQCLGKVFFD